MASFTIHPIPVGSQLTSAIGTDDDADKNDFEVLIVADENVTDLAQSDISVNNGASIVSLEGKNSVYIATVRPPTTAAVVTFTIAADAVAEGNLEATHDIRVSTYFPDADAESPTSLFTHGLSNVGGIAVTPTRILVSQTNSLSLQVYTHSGTHLTGETLTLSTMGLGFSNRTQLDTINGDILVYHFLSGRADNRVIRWGGDGTTLEQIERYEIITTGRTGRGVAHTPLGIAQIESGTSGTNPLIRIQAYGTTDTTEYDLATERLDEFIAHQNDLIYAGNEFSEAFRAYSLWIGEIVDADINFLKPLNVEILSTIADISLYRDTLYLIGDNDVYTLDIKKYRPIAKNTKALIHPVIVVGATTLDLTQYAPDAETITFDVGFDKPPYLSIANNTLTVSGTFTQATPCFVKLKAFNRIDATETGSFGFYLIILPSTASVWNSVSELAMRANSTYNLYQLVVADSIAFRAGRAKPTDSTLSDGIFTIGTVGGRVEFTATHNGLESHIALQIDVIQTPANLKGSRFRYKVEIEGIDVSADLLNAPQVSENLDPVAINETRINEATVTLKGIARYDANKADNFWETNNLNAGGFQNAIKVYTEHLIAGSWVENLLFSGIILESLYPVGRAEFRLNCVDASHVLQNIVPQTFGRLEKWAETRKTTEEATYQGVYAPETALLPIQPQSGKAWADRTALTLSMLENASEGSVPADTGYLTETEFRTAGGFTEVNPVLNYNTAPRGMDLEAILRLLAAGETHAYNIEIDLTGKTLDTDYSLNRGNVSHHVQATRNTVLMKDWVHDDTADRILMLLSNPEQHLQDLIVEYSLTSNTYRTMHTLPKNIKAHRIERRNSTNYYILTSGNITQDRSDTDLPRQSDKTGFAYDSVAEGSTCKIYHFNASTRTLTEHVAEDDDRPPQVGIHYFAGFENDLYIDEFEGIRPEYRGAFKWYSGNLYYRYATDSEFGVARVNTSGTTTEMIDQTTLNYHNHLNFAFDITSGGDIYFVYATGDAETSTLTIQRRTSGGTLSTRLSQTRAIGDFNALGLDFGAFLGAYEALFHDDTLYFLAPIQKAQLGDDTQSVINPDVNIEQLTAEKTGERNVTTSTNLNPSNLTLAPGDDIPLRIDFDGTATGATQSDLTVYGGTIESFSISSDMIDVTIRPESQTHHKTILVDLAEDAVDQTNEAWRITIDFETTRSRTKASGMALYSCNVTDSSPSLTLIETWDFVQCGAVNLTVHDSEVHFVESPPACRVFTPYNPDLDSYSEDDGFNTLPENDGTLQKINTSGEVEDLGFVWFTDRPFNVFPTRLLSIGDDLHITAGYGSTDTLLKHNSLSSRAENYAHLVFGKSLKYVLPTFSPTRSVHAELADLSKRVNATVSFEKGIISVRDRSPFRALTDGSTGTGTGNISYDTANKVFPSSGYLMIDSEVIKYTGTGTGTFTGITRGVLGTMIADHANNAKILFLDNITDRDYKSITLTSDTNRVKNIIRNSARTAEVRDADSIAKFSELPYTLDLSLTRHQTAWIESVFDEYLAELKDLQSIVNLQIRQDFGLQLVEIVPFLQEGVLKAMRIISVRYEESNTTIRGRTITP